MSKRVIFLKKISEMLMLFFNAKHIEGKNNMIADWLSRFYVDSQGNFHVQVLAMDKFETILQIKEH